MYYYTMTNTMSEQCFGRINMASKEYTTKHKDLIILQHKTESWSDERYDEYPVGGGFSRFKYVKTVHHKTNRYTIRYKGNVIYRCLTLVNARRFIRDKFVPKLEG